MFPSAEHKPPHTAALMHSMFLEAMAYMTGSAFDESMDVNGSLPIFEILLRSVRWRELGSSSLLAFLPLAQPWQLTLASIC